MSARTGADNAVKLLRHALTLPIISPPGPEHEAAFAGFHITKEDFDIWYRIEMRNRHFQEKSFHEPTEQECAQAYESFQAGRNSFF